jgi:hypothetical protein
MAMNKRLATVGLGAFLLADIVLVALALRPPPVNPLTAGPTGTAVSVVSPTPEPTGEPTDGASATEPTSAATTTAKPGGPVPVQRIVIGLDATHAWRANAGSCESGGALVEVTTDGGETWTKRTSPARAISRIQPLQAGTGFILGAGADCEIKEWTTKTNGQAWAGPKALVGAWARQISKPTTVITPQHPAATPCGDLPVLDLSRTSAEQAEALCEDGSVKVSNNAGTSWAASGEAPDAVALTNRLEGEVLTTYAARVVASCAGVQIVKVIQGKPAVAVTCVKATVPTEAGQIGISAAPDAGWLVVGDETWTAGADLKSWTKA